MINFMNLQNCQNWELTKSKDRRHLSQIRSIPSVIVLKSDNFSFPTTVPRPNMLKTLYKRAEKFLPVEPNCLNMALNQFMFGIGSKLKLGHATIALGLYIYYGVVLRKIGYSSNQLLYASVCVLLASKVIERDILIVNLSNLRKVACNYIAKEQYARAERNVLLALDYNPLIQTFVSFVEYYLYKGILFQSEKRYENQELHAFEQRILDKCISYIRSGQFLCYKPDKLAAYIIYNARKEAGLPGWLRQIEAITKFSYSEIQSIIKQIKDIDSKSTIQPLPLKTSNSLKPRQLVLKKKPQVSESLNNSPIAGVERQGRKLFGNFASNNILAPLRMSKSLATLHQ